MKSGFKAVLFITCVAGAGWLAYDFGRQQSGSMPVPAPTVPPVAGDSTPLPQPFQASAERDQFQKALDLRESDKLAEARDALRVLLAKLQVAGSNEAKALAEEAQKALGEINVKLLLTRSAAPEKVDYVVQGGDSLSRIARQFNTTVEVLQKANSLRDTVIQPGNRLRVTPTKFTVAVSKSANTLLLTDDGRFFKLYHAGTGQYSTTPTGTFKITDRIPNPPWWKDGRTIPYGSKENILGTHWLALDIPHYGIHGTWDAETIGHQSSAGCIRLLNDDVEELFTMLPPGTPVEIKD